MDRMTHSDKGISSNSLSVEWVLEGLRLACVIPDMEHCTLDNGNIILYHLDYSETNIDDAMIMVWAGFTKSQELVECAHASDQAKSLEDLVLE